MNEKGMVPKDKGWGMSNLGYGEKTHVLPPLFVTFLVLPNLSNLFNVLTLLVGGSYCMRKRGHGKTWVKRKAIPLSSPRLHSPHGRWFSHPIAHPHAQVFSHAELWSVLPHAEGKFAHSCVPRWSVHPPDGLLIRAHRGGRFPPRAG